MTWLWNLIPAPFRIAVVAAATALATGAAFGLYDRLIDDPAVRRAALKGYVAEVKVKAAEARAAEMARQLAAARAAQADFATAFAAAEAADAAAREDLENRIADHERRLESDGRDCRLSDADIEWLLHH